MAAQILNENIRCEFGAASPIFVVQLSLPQDLVGFAKPVADFYMFTVIILLPVL